MVGSRKRSPTNELAEEEYIKRDMMQTLEKAGRALTPDERDASTREGRDYKPRHAGGSVAAIVAVRRRQSGRQRRSRRQHRRRH